jgi:hypothetical protein
MVAQRIACIPEAMEPALFQLFHDRVHSILLTRITGAHVAEDFFARDRKVAKFVAHHGLARGLMDDTGVTRIDIPMATIVRRAKAPPLLPGQTRVVVAADESANSLARVIAVHRNFSRKVEPLLVESCRVPTCARL